MIGRTRIRVPLHQPAALAWLYWRESWKSRLISAILRQRTGAFVDVGANVGQTLADFLAGNVSSRYIGIEPNPSCVAYISELAAINRLPMDILPVGLWRESGLKLLNFPDNSRIDPMAFFHAGPRTIAARSGQWVMTGQFDDLLVALGGPPIGLLKIDVEGAELEVLRGANALLTSNPPPILCEVLLADADADLRQYHERVAALWNLLAERHYRVFRVHQTSADSVPALIPVNEFPIGIWTQDSADQCDYAFLPAGFDF